MTTRRSLLAAAVTAALIAGTVTAWLATTTTHGTTHHGADTPRLPAQPFTTTVSVANGRHVVAGSTMYVRVGASTPIQAATLYDGSRVVGTARPRGNGSAVTFAVPAADTGNHAFTAHVSAAAGSASSEPDLVLVQRGHGQQRTRFPARRGETSAAAAARLGVAATAVHVAGTTVVETLPADPTSPTAPAASTTLEPAATVLEASVSGCRIHVVTSASAPVEVERASATDGGYVVAGMASAARPLDIDDAPGGQVLLQARVNGVLSAIVSVTLSDSCTPGSWTGSVTIRNGLLVLPSAPGSTYLYLSADDGNSQRVPADPSAFLDASTRLVPVADQLPALAGHRLVVEAWRPPADATQHAKLVGRGELTVPAASSIVEAIGLPSSITLTYRGDSYPGAVVTVTKATPILAFDVSTDSQHADHVAWQILQHPLTPANQDLLPLGLLKSGSAPITEGSGTIVIRSNLIPHGTPRTNDTVYLRVLAFSGRNELGLVSTVTTVNLPPAPVPPPGPVPIGRPTIAGVHATFPHAPNPGEASCIRMLKIPHPPNPALVASWPSTGTYCFYTVSVGSEESGDCPIWGICQLIAAGAAVVSAVAGAIVKVASAAWDFVSSAYNSLIDDATKLLAAVAGGPFCALTAAISSSAGRDCKAVAALVSTAAVDAVLSAYGLPTHLPSSAEVGQLAKGDLTELGTQLLQEAGVPCGSLDVDPDEGQDARELAGDLGVHVPHENGVCQAVIDELLQRSQSQVADQARSEILTQDGVTDDGLSADPRYVFEQEPDGQPQPITVQITATGAWSDGAKAHYTCPITVHDTYGYPATEPPYRATLTSLHSAAGPGRSTGPWVATANLRPNPHSSAWDGPVTGPITLTVTPNASCLHGGPRTVVGELLPPIHP